MEGEPGAGIGSFRHTVCVAQLQNMRPTMNQSPATTNAYLSWILPNITSSHVRNGTYWEKRRTAEKLRSEPLDPRGNEIVAERFRAKEIKSQEDREDEEARKAAFRKKTKDCRNARGAKP